jgi:hypothetical protein
MAKNKSSNVTIQRKELRDMQEKYAKISDAIAGEEAVKAAGEKYLPIPSDCEHNIVTDPRYVAYQTRALYYNVCQPTRDALVGQLFLRPPVVVLPTELDAMIADMNGEGLNLEQLVKRAANHVLPYGRGGFLADFPITEGEVTKAQIDSGEIHPIIRFFEPWAIRNWKIKKIGKVKKIVMLVLDEMYEESQEGGDEFDIEITLRQRVYRLENGVCSVELFDSEATSLERYEIKGQDGNPLDTIPFEFIGSENNDSEVDEPPFLNLANINLAHYRNSADYEEGCFLCGQPTPVYAGLTEDWVDNYFPKGIPFGSRASIPLPEGATAQLLQAMPNMVAFEAMKHKEDQMFSIGAKIINRDQKIEKKEKEVEIEAASQKSVLTTIKNNLQMALLAAVKQAANFIGVEITNEHKIELNENFDLTSMDPDEMRSMSELYEKSQITFSELREGLRRSGIAKMPDEEAQAAIKSDQAFRKTVEPEPAPPVGKLKPNPAK